MITIPLPLEDDMLDPHAHIYTKLQRLWIEATTAAIEEVQTFEANGASTDATADRLRMRWEEATTAMDAFCDFASKYSRELGPGPGRDPRSCMRCQRPVPEGDPLCNPCLIHAIAS